VIRVVGTTLTDLRKEPSFHSELLTQVTNGVDLEVLKTEGEWCHVRQRDGYEGWAYATYLFEPDHGRPATHLVMDPTLVLHASPDESADVVTRLPIGSAIAVAEQDGDWARVELVRNAIPTGWVRVNGLRPIASLSLAPREARQQIVADARRLTGVQYLWGGTTAWGIDCSGLSQLCHRLSGYTLRRDAWMQFGAGKAVDPPFEPGDLLFFHSDTNREKITHVAISTGGWRIIHSSRSRNGVYEEDLEAETSRGLRERFAGARTFLR
jgi:cell wall-associated NlpC family hydrolase